MADNATRHHVTEAIWIMGDDDGSVLDPIPDLDNEYATILQVVDRLIARPDLVAMLASRDGSDHAPTGNDKATCEHERSDHMKAVRTGTDLTGWVPICKKCKQAYNPHWPDTTLRGSESTP